MGRAEERARRITPEQREAMSYAMQPGARSYRYIKRHFLNDLDLVRPGCGCCLSAFGQELAQLVLLPHPNPGAEAQ